MIVFDNVSKFYPTKDGGRTTIIENFSAVLRPGINIGILGKNGAGKSTMMRMIAGGEPPSGGAIYRAGRISWPLGFAGGFSKELTGRQNLRFISRLYNVDFQSVVDFVAEFSELGRFLDEPLGTYSSGMRARLAFGSCMAIDFDYYLIDEVIAVGDKNFRRKCAEVFAERRERASVLLVSHSAGMLRQFCDIGGVLADGQLTFYDTLDEAIEVHDANQDAAVGRAFA